VPPRDPLELYDEACCAFAYEATSRPHGKDVAALVDEEYNEGDDDDDDDDDDDGNDEDFDLE